MKSPLAFLCCIASIDAALFGFDAVAVGLLAVAAGVELLARNLTPPPLPPEE